MRILIAEDDLTSRLFMKKFLSKYGQCDLAMNGLETIDSVMNAIDEKKPYELICLDVMMPKLDGIRTLKTIREIEKNNLKEHQVPSKIIMTTALNDKETVEEAYKYGCEAYAWKPIDVKNFNAVLEELGLIKP